MSYKMKKTDFCLLFLIVLSFLTKYYHSFGVNSISYGSGDAFELILGATNLEKYPVNYLMMYVYRIFYEVIDLSLFNLTFYFTPILSAILLIFIFKILEKNVNLRVAFFSCFFIVTNPWMSYYSTEPSKALFVLLFFAISLFFFYRYKQDKNKKEILFSFIALSFSSLFFHSAFMFVPIYFILLYINIYKKINTQNLKSFLKLFVLFLIIFMIISFPLYTFKYWGHEKKVEKENIEFTELGKMGLFGRYLGAMRGAITHPEYLGYNNFLRGIQMFLVYNWIWTFFLISLIFLAFGYIFGFYREKLLLDFILIFLFVFVFISLQWTSSSHGSRYPQYVTLFLFIILGYSLDLIFRFTEKIVKKNYITVFLIFIIVISFISPSYNLKYVEGLRRIYIPQLETKDLIEENNIVINEENQVLYLGWPAITLSLNEMGVNNAYLHTFGWGSIDLSYITSTGYITDNKINYYIYDHTGTDYFNSADEVLRRLQNEFEVVLIDKTKRNDLYIAIYEIKK